MQRGAFFYLLALLTSTGCASSIHKTEIIQVEPLLYEVDLLDRADDLFKVKLRVNDLMEENAVYQFAATAPGTYLIMDIGRYVRSFKAFDVDGTEITTNQISTNQWQIENPLRVREIRYTIAETWDTVVDSNLIFRMAGSSIEEDHVQLMGHCVFGYPTGMQSRPLSIKLSFPESWKVGTALRQNQESLFIANSYDHVVDSPILLGRLSKAKLRVNGSKVEIYTYSKTDKVKSKDILNNVRAILLSAAQFMKGLPVNRYTFLFHFEDATVGAWEHSYSSNYVYNEADFERIKTQNLPVVVAHEFFHVITPLNIHSEIIQRFNFVEPVPSRHLWLYEGTTEWASHIMQLRSGLIGLDDYLRRITRKLRTNDNFSKDFSLLELSLESFSPKGQRQYANIYHRGAIVAGLLDIRLLELSYGKRGLREVINDLSKKFGPEKAFSEANFFDTFARQTFPEITDFFDKYVKAAQPLPIADYYGKLGIKYTPEVHTGEQIPAGGFQIRVGGTGTVFVTGVQDQVKKFGLQNGDAIVGLNGEEVTLKNIQAIFTEFHNLDAGTPYELTIERAGERMNLSCEKITRERVNRHVLEVDENATLEQVKLREAWMRNL